jgi:hypothetical protein
VAARLRYRPGAGGKSRLLATGAAEFAGSGTQIAGLAFPSPQSCI